MDLDRKKERVRVLKNTLDFLKGRAKELLAKDSYEEFDKGIIEEVIKLIREHEAELEKLEREL